MTPGESVRTPEFHQTAILPSIRHGSGKRGKKGENGQKYKRVRVKALRIAKHFLTKKVSKKFGGRGKGAISLHPLSRTNGSDKD